MDADCLAYLCPATEREDDICQDENERKHT